MEISYTKFDKQAIIESIKSFGKKIGIILAIYWFFIYVYNTLNQFIDINLYFTCTLKIVVSIITNILLFSFIFESNYNKQIKKTSKDKSILTPISLIFIFITFIFVSNFLSSILGKILKIFGLSSNSNNYVYNNVGEYILLIITTIIVPAFAEEFAFRRCMLNSLRKYGDSIAIIVSSVCFGLLHSNVEQMVFAILCGFALGYIYIYTNNYTIVVCLHIINNAISFLFNIISIQVSEQMYNCTFDIFIISAIVIGVIGFVYLSREKADFLYINGFEGDILFSERITALIKGILISSFIATIVFFTISIIL